MKSEDQFHLAADDGSQGPARKPLETRVAYLLANPDALKRFVAAAEANANDYLCLNRQFADYREAAQSAVEIQRGTV